MRKTFFIAIILSAAALLLLPLAPASTAPLSHSARKVLGSLRPAAQDPSAGPAPFVVPEPPIPPIHIHVDPPEIDPPEIDPAEVDIHPEEIEREVMEQGDADRGHFDRGDIDHDNP